MPRNRPIAVDALVERLRSFERQHITKERVAALCSEIRIDDASLKRYVLFRDDRYTRNLVWRDALFELMVICWKPGQRTPVHSHNGQLGWMLVERGGVDVVNYKYLSCNAPQNQNVVGLDCLAGATEIDLREISHERAVERGDVSTVDKIQTIHSIGCPADLDEPAVTVHLYSTPFDSCVTYDLENRRCGRRTLFWDTRYGEAVTDATASPRPEALPLAREKTAE